MTATAFLVVVLLMQQVTTTPVTQARGPASQCATASDEKYGLSTTTPVQVGGGAMFGPSRERRFLDALRGPEGQTVRYRRTGSLPGPDGDTILDAYETTYDGLTKPITIYVDEYHFVDPMAPRGFTCGQPIALGPPPPDPFLTSQGLLTTAIEQGNGREFQPIPLDPDGATTHGVVYDHFRMVARAARAAAQSGVTLNPQALPRSIAQPRTVVLAYPMSCANRTIAPMAIEIVTAQGAPPPQRDGEYAKDAALGRLLPGVQAPAASIAATFVMSTLRPIDSVHITYADGSCTGGDTRTILPVKFSDARMIDATMPSLPPGAAAPDTPLPFQVLVDLDGKLQHPVYLGGVSPLSQAAIDAIGQWRSEPQRVNGAPIARPAIVQVTFKK